MTDRSRSSHPRSLARAFAAAYALVALGCVGHLVRLARDPWTGVWRLPGRSLLLVLVQPIPIAVVLLVALSYLRRALEQRAARRAAGFGLAFAVGIYCTLDGGFAAITERHLLETGQLAFLFSDGAFRAASVVSPLLVLIAFFLVAAFSYALVTSLPALSEPPPLGFALAAFAIVLVVDVIALRLARAQDAYIYRFAIDSNPIYGLTAAADRLALGLRPGVITTIPGLRPVRTRRAPPEATVPPRPLVEPRLVLIVLFDGFRADFLNPQITPRLHSIASSHGIVVENYYTAYPGTDRAVYSLLHGQHPLFADADLLLKTRPSTWLRLFHEHSYQTQVFQSNPHIYRFLRRVYGEFDSVHYGGLDLPPGDTDHQMVQGIRDSIETLRPSDRLFAFALLHSSHFPYNGQMFGSPAQNYESALSMMDEMVGDLLQDLLNSGVSFLALVGGDHGTHLGECGKVGYLDPRPETLHTAMAVVGSKEAAPAIDRLKSMQGSMVRMEALLPLLFDPAVDPASLRRPGAQWNVAMPPGAFTAESPFVVHDLAGNALQARLLNNSAFWSCKRLDDCGPFTADQCRAPLLAGAGEALLLMQRRSAVP
jgi:hypothetical protein